MQDSPQSVALSRSVVARRVRVEETGPVGEHDRLRAVAETELLEHVRHMGLHGCLADVQLVPDLCVGEPVGEKTEDSLLPGRELAKA